MSETVSSWSAKPSNHHRIPKDDICIDSLWCGKITIFVTDKSTKIGSYDADVVYNGTLSLNMGAMIVSSGFTWFNLTVSGDDVIVECDDCYMAYRFIPNITI